MKRLIIAIAFLTRVPVPQVRADADDFAAAIRYYPLVGLIIGAGVALAGWGGGLIDPWLGAIAALIIWVGITGALHLDGLGDLADGLGAAHGAPDDRRARLLAVMADPHIGSFGVVAIVMQLLAKLVLLHAVAPAGWAMLAGVPFAARIGPLFWARLLPPLHEGLGATVARSARPRDLIGWALVLAGAAVLVPALIAAPLIIAIFAWWLWRRIGGINGDAHGAGIELTETGLLALLILLGGGG